MAAETQTPAANVLPPPRTEVGVIGWMHANLFSSRLNSALTVVSSALLVVILWYGLRWIFWSADWTVIERVGGLFLIGSYNTELACPGQNCFWRPQVSLLLVTGLLGLIWGILGAGVARNIAVLTAVVAALFAFLPYGLEDMGWDVRILLLANLPATAIGWALARYTPLGQPRWAVAWGVAAFLITLVAAAGHSKCAGPATGVRGVLGRV